MKRAHVYHNGRLAGLLEQTRQATYTFTYTSAYLEDASTPPISLTLPKRPTPYQSDTLFPFFFGLLSEGSTKVIQCQTLKIDEEDPFELLVRTGEDCIGSVSVMRAHDGNKE